MSQIKLFGGRRSSSRSASRAARSNMPRPSSQARQGSRVLKRLTKLFLVLFILEGLYFTAAYSSIPFIKKWRTIYIETAMSTMRHQWLATAFLPKRVIDEVVDNVNKAQEAQVGINSSWGGQTGSTHQPSTSGTAPDSAEPLSQEALDFFQVFWELDQTATLRYLEKNPQLLENGWENLYINEAGLDDSGTELYTTMGEQVLAIDAANGVLLVRVSGSGYRGVLAVAKDPSRLSVQSSSMLGSAGQYAGDIAKKHNGILAMTANGFIDVDGEGNQGRGNGGILAGYTMCDGDAHGTHMGWSYKRLELREDDLMYIVDASSPVNAKTTDAVEFTPALIVDGKTLVDANCGWTALNPRACIGQSDRYEVLMLVIEGRLIDSVGTDVIECSEILSRHNCMQAMNLDGGTSAILYYDGEYVTRCSNTACPYGRTLPNAFVYARAGE